MMRRPWQSTASFIACLVLGGLAAAGCGVSVAKGGENAATHPASGIWVSPTVGAGNISGHPNVPVRYQPPQSTGPGSSPHHVPAALSKIESAVTGGCWQDSHQGSFYGAYDQVFWWQGDCGDTIAQVDVEIYPSAAAAAKAAHHGSPAALLRRYRDGAALVDVYSNAPFSVVSQLSGIKGLKPVQGYAS